MDEKCVCVGGVRTTTRKEEDEEEEDEMSVHIQSCGILPWLHS
jgi:hypothetical protein